jgi:hypothetical protein
MGFLGSVVSVIEDAVSGTYDWAVDEIVDDALGLDNLAIEMDRWKEDATDVVKTFSGGKAKDSAELSAKQEQVKVKQKAAESELDTLSEEVERKAILGEIFQISGSNKFDRRAAELTIEFEKITAEFDAMLEAFNETYSFTNSLASHGYLGKLFSAFLNITGGVFNLARKLITGEANSDDWNMALQIATSVVIIIFGTPTQKAAAAVYLLTLLDSAFNGGGLMDVALRALDFVLNDVLQLEDWLGSDWGHLDKDSDYYAETKATITTLTMLVSGYIMMDGFGEIAQGANVPTWLPAATQATGTYSSLRLAYDTYKLADDIINYNKTRQELDDKVSKDIKALQAGVYKKNRSKMYAAYRDVAYIQNQTDDIINSYVSFSVGNPNTIFDPQSTIAMNSRYERSSEGLTFGFEDMFDYDAMAGNSSYTYNKLYQIHLD